MRERVFEPRGKKTTYANTNENLLPPTDELARSAFHYCIFLHRFKLKLKGSGYEKISLILFIPRF